MKEDYVSLTEVIYDPESYFLHYLSDEYAYDEGGVVQCMHWERHKKFKDVIKLMGDSFRADMTTKLHRLLSFAILDDIYAHSGRYIHHKLKHFITDSEKNPLHSYCSPQSSYEESFQKVISAFFDESTLAIPKEELVLNCEKQSLSWWKDKLMEVAKVV